MQFSLYKGENIEFKLWQYKQINFSKDFSKVIYKEE